MLLVGVEKDDVEDELIAYISRHFWFANNNIGIILFMMPTIIYTMAEFFLSRPLLVLFF
jgi:hypothetical protein